MSYAPKWPTCEVCAAEDKSALEYARSVVETYTLSEADWADMRAAAKRKRGRR